MREIDCGFALAFLILSACTSEVDYPHTVMGEVPSLGGLDASNDRREGSGGDSPSDNADATGAAGRFGPQPDGTCIGPHGMRVGRLSPTSLVIVDGHNLTEICTREAVQGSGIARSEERPPAAFVRIQHKASLPVEVRVDGQQTVVVHCDDNLLEHISTQVVDQTLVIDSQKRLVTKQVCKVGVHMDHLDGIDVRWAASAVVDGNLDALSMVEASEGGQVELKSPVRGQALAVRVAGFGAIRVARYEGKLLQADALRHGTIRVADGSAEEVFVDASGSSEVDAGGVAAMRADVVARDTAEVRVRASTSLKAVVEGAAEVYVAGQPKARESRLSSAGTLHYL